MIPMKNDFLKWLDDKGDLRKDAPNNIKEDHEKWQKHYEKWKKEMFEKVTQ